jgi:protein-tyrosine-phosphatase
MNILFLCKWNRFRSKIAEIYFNQINRNKNLKAKSAGIIKGWTPFDKYQVEEAKKLGTNLRGKTRGLDIKLLKWADVIILTAKDVPKSIFEFKTPVTALKNKKIKVIVWKIPDVMFGDRKACRKAIKAIMKNVENLVGGAK